ncbi:Lysine-ketoglutarate reductase/saccharopine dehydrogenase1 [Zea mays]|uniref:Lysine-ketoglutarate reductase/saccharopine dehydrogenase1 n=1 Tax=Zea mays TaxID=4577 RepID=A0A1D6QD48_MAIZE|nr:Lysine-ketoglutarate reductase/saccharopine dehydrogenase1 [Zea mays]
MYWEKRFPPLLNMDQLQQLMETGCPLVGVCDITCDIGGSIEFINKSTSIERPFFRFSVAASSITTVTVNSSSYRCRSGLLGC